MPNAYFLAKFRFDTAENEPAKNLRRNAKFANFANAQAPRPAPLQQSKSASLHLLHVLPPRRVVPIDLMTPPV